MRVPKIYNEPEAMREIHKIRERISAEIKRMPPEEYTKRVNRQAEALAAKYGFTLAPSAQAAHLHART